MFKVLTISGWGNDYLGVMNQSENDKNKAALRNRSAALVMVFRCLIFLPFGQRGRWRG